MTLIELLEKIDTWQNYVRVQDVYGELLTDYDGRNSIDVKYNDWNVYDFLIRGNMVIVWIEESEV